MTAMLRRGLYQARFARNDTDLGAAQALRHLCFFDAAGLPARPLGRDRDRFDARCRHVLIEEVQGGRLVCCFRVLPVRNAAALQDCYAAQHYRLDGLARHGGPMAEIGRFCIHPAVFDADVLRVAWGALAGLVDAEGFGLLFGCSSFMGADVARHAPALAHLHATARGPDALRPAARAADAVPLAAAQSDAATGIKALPPLLRSYIAMGGWVGDHAVPDPELDTLHVFTALDVTAVPPARARALRAVAGIG